MVDEANATRIPPRWPRSKSRTQRPRDQGPAAVCPFAWQALA